ncbi:MAG: hypothetical protein JRM80_08970 [Nitrososphaerota archaeon]|nr:hypothetical protein [Nitrososphaerota archaeon]
MASVYAGNYWNASRKASVVVGVVIVLGLLAIFFLAPLTSYSGEASSLSGVNPIVAAEGATFTAQVSFSYSWFGCGEVYSPVALITTYPYVNQGNFQPVSQYYTLYSGGAWQCK